MQDIEDGRNARKGAKSGAIRGRSTRGGPVLVMEERKGWRAKVIY